jgi:hypothetical protein
MTKITKILTCMALLFLASCSKKLTDNEKPDFYLAYEKEQDAIKLAKKEAQKAAKLAKKAIKNAPKNAN